jgi:hypothetical protein
MRWLDPYYCKKCGKRGPLDGNRRCMYCHGHEVILDKEPKWGTFQERLSGGLKEYATILSGAAVIVGLLIVLESIFDHFRVTVDHHWWGYRAWNFYCTWWAITVPFTPATIFALVPDERDGPTRGQRLFTWNSAVAGFCFLLFGIFWSVQKLGPWLGIPAFSVMFVLAIMIWAQLDARIGLQATRIQRKE